MSGFVYDQVWLTTFKYLITHVIMAEKIIRIVNIAFRTRKFVCILKCQSFQTLHSTSSWGCRNYNHDHIVAKFWSLLNCLIIHSEHLANESVHAKVSFCFSIAYMGFPSCKRGWDKAVHIEEMLETKHPMCIRFYVSLIYTKNSVLQEDCVLCLGQNQ
jgi:hypothetical protein